MATHLGHGMLGFTRKRQGLRPARGSSSAGTLTHCSWHHGGPVGGPRMTFRGARSTTRSWQNYHMDSHGWVDIGYNLLMDGLGRLYQGRPVGRLPAAVGNHNSNSLGICVMQDGRYHGLNVLQRRTMKLLFMYGVPKWNVPPLRRLRNLGHNEYSGHASNECPGTKIKRHLIWRRGRPNR